MKDEPHTFGGKIRASRQRAGFNAIRLFVEALRQEGLAYTVEAVGHWERGTRKPSRETLLSVFRVLVQATGISHHNELNEMLNDLGYVALTEDEIAHHFPQLKSLPLNLSAAPHYHRFIGRKSTLSLLINLLSDAKGAKVVAITGLGGIGKTALAREVSILATQRGVFKDVLWESAKQHEFIGAKIQTPSSSIGILLPVLTSYAHQLGIEQPPLQLALLKRQLQEVLQTRTCLVVLDNLETVAEGREAAATLHQLVAGSPGSRALITSRERLSDESYLYDYRIEGLAETETLELLRSDATQRGAHSMLSNQQLIKQVHRVTGGMPLAIVLIVSQYLMGIALDEELERLKRATNEEELYRFIYFDLWLHLPEVAQKLLITLGTFATGALRMMVQHYTRFDDDTLLSAVRDLNHVSLLEMRASPVAQHQLYDIHPMTRWFVNSPLEAMWREHRGQKPTQE